MYSLWYILGLAFCGYNVAGHGYLSEPPARQSMWRYGFDTPVNYNDGEQNCGGKPNQWENQGGKCGLCGDPYQDPQPRAYEAGGSMAPVDRPLSRCYNQDDNVINIIVKIYSHHQGYFEFRLCENNNMASYPAADCIYNGRLLTVAGTTDTRYDITDDIREYYNFQLDMPNNVICTQCILHWKYNAGNNWGCDDTGCGMGLGEQEQFHNCADIAILPDCQNYTTVRPTTRDVTTPTTTTTTITTRQPETTTKSDPNRCRATNVWAGSSEMDAWCTETCLHDLPYCPQSHCLCDQSTARCTARRLWSGRVGMDEWCMNSCSDIPPSCPQSHCTCNN